MQRGSTMVDFAVDLIPSLVRRVIRRLGWETAKSWRMVTIRVTRGRLSGRSPNTLNICLGHVSFPRLYCDLVDLAIAPRLIVGPHRVAVVDDSYVGEFGSALSEYVQLMWLCDNYDAITSGYDFVRIFQYRRFIGEKAFGESSNLPWARRIKGNMIEFCRLEFNRSSAAELFGTPFEFSNGMLGQYADTHVLEDMLNFSKFLTQTGIFEPGRTASFITERRLIPSSNMGVFRVATLKEILQTLKQAAAFVHSDYFVQRDGYQRRSVGFLLERLNSYLILERIRLGISEANFGHQIIISDDYGITVTDQIAQGADEAVGGR